MDWAEMQLRTTLDYGHGSWWTTFLSGALNYQVRSDNPHPMYLLSMLYSSIHPISLSLFTGNSPSVPLHLSTPLSRYCSHYPTTLQGIPTSLPYIAQLCPSSQSSFILSIHHGPRTPRFLNEINQR